MSKKMGFLVGLILGGAAAVMAFKRLDPIKRQKLIDNVNQKASDLKDKAVDYAFYASDAMDDASSQLHKGANGATSHAKSALDSAHQHAAKLKDRFNDKFAQKHSDKANDTQFHTAADHLRSELNRGSKSNDIVINASQNFNQTSKSTPVIFYPNGSVKPF